MGELAHTVAGWTRFPVVALVQARREMSRGPNGDQPSNFFPVPATKLPGFSLDSAALEPRDLARLIGVKSTVEATSRPGGLALWGRTWEMETTHPNGTRVPLPQGWLAAKASCARLTKSGVTCELPPRQAIAVGSLVDLPWSKPVKLHWLFQKMWVVPAAKNADEKTFLGTVAAAVAGKLVDGKDGYRIDIDSHAFRLRAQATVLARAPKGVNGVRSAIQQGGVDIAVETWKWMDDATLRDLFREPYATIAFTARRGSPLDIALSRYYAAYKWRAEHGVPGPTNDIGGDAEPPRAGGPQPPSARLRLAGPRHRWRVVESWGRHGPLLTSCHAGDS